jgi:ATP-dependent HslUV protease ATP-binding subunit HslU
MSSYSFSPREIVSELNRYIIGQQDAKRAVAIALRNRWRRGQLTGEMREEVLPKNILMIGPTGVGKTEISRRLAKLANAPFVKVEATKFTEVGYVGRDVEQIIRDLVEASITLTRDSKRNSVGAKAEIAAEERVIDVLVGDVASAETRQTFRKKIREGDIDDKIIEIDVKETASNPMSSFEIPGMPGSSLGMMNLGDLMGGMGSTTEKKKMTVKEALKVLESDESDKLVDEDSLIKEAIYNAEQTGIVFIDEIDKIAGKSGRNSGEVSREGVQRDLLPLIEGCSVSTKHGTVKTDHILFITSGAFSVSKPSDLLPELQGRLPIRVQLRALTEEDFIHILTEPDFSLIKQYIALLGTENVTLSFTQNGINEIAKLSAKINETVENIGARRLHTVLERILDEISFEATDKNGVEVIIDQAYVTKHIGDLAATVDLAKFIL